MIRKLSFILLISTVLLSCTNNAAQHAFLYSDGTEISDTNQINMLEKQLDTLVDGKEGEKNLSVQTSLSRKFNDRFEKLSKQFSWKLSADLKEENPEYAEAIDSLYKMGRMGQVALILINNKTNEVEDVTYLNTSPKVVFESRYRYKALRLYGYMLAFGKGKELSDTFAYEFEDKLRENDYCMPKLTVGQSFCVLPGGNVPIPPYAFYSISDWIMQNHQLDNDLDFSEFRTGKMQNHKTSIFDLTKTLSTIQNDGKYSRPLFIRSVKDENGETIYQATKRSGIQVIEPVVVQKMKTLMNNYMTGMGRYFVERKNISKDNFVYYGGQSGNQHWCLSTNKEYTIGIAGFFGGGFRARVLKGQERYILSNLLREVLKSIP